jgi:hypothetical protein
MLQDESLCQLESAIEIEGSDESLESIGEDVGIILPESERLSSRELDRLREIKPPSDESEIASSHECRAYIGELSLRLFAEFVVESFGDRELEDSITEVFESFIGLGIAGMSFI